MAERKAYFLDTSALVKRYVDENGTSWVAAIVAARPAHRLYIARITVVEVYSAISRRAYRNEITHAESAKILARFRRHLLERYRIIDLDTALLDRAARLARKRRLRAYDAVQLAVALYVDELRQATGLTSTTLLSADRDLNAAATAEGLAVDNPDLHP